MLPKSLGNTWLGNITQCLGNTGLEITGQGIIGLWNKRHIYTGLGNTGQGNI